MKLMGKGDFKATTVAGQQMSSSTFRAWFHRLGNLAI